MKVVKQRREGKVRREGDYGRDRRKVGREKVNRHEIYEGKGKKCCLSRIMCRHHWHCSYYLYHRYNYKHHHHHHRHHHHHHHFMDKMVHLNHNAMSITTKGSPTTTAYNHHHIILQLLPPYHNPAAATTITPSRPHNHTRHDPPCEHTTWTRRFRLHTISITVYFLLHLFFLHHRGQRTDVTSKTVTPSPHFWPKLFMWK